LGGGTFDVAYVVYNSKRFRVVATDGDVRLGGTDWTRRLVDFAADRYAQQFGVDLRQDLISCLRLSRRCEDAKHALSDREQTTLEVFSNL
jgi:molecular chaperone DnaK